MGLGDAPDLTNNEEGTKDMAIMQERYVRITSGNSGDSAIQERDLNGLLFTLGRGWIGQGAFGTDSILKCYSVDQVRKYFSSGSDEVKFAQKYFAYISPSGSSPASLSFARVAVTGDVAENTVLLSYGYGVIDPQEQTYGYAWFTSDTAGNVIVTFNTSPAPETHVTLYSGGLPSAGGTAVGTYTFVNTVKTAKDQVVIGSSPAETAANFAAVINGTDGFYGQRPSDFVTATVEGNVMTLTAKKAGAAYSPSLGGNDNLPFGISTVDNAGVDGGTSVTPVVYESPADALSRVNSLSNNFGSFAILAGDITEASWTNTDLNALLTQNAGYNYKYLASMPILPLGGNFEDTSNEIAFVTAVGTQNGASANRGKDGTCAAIPMAIFGAIDYNGVGTAPNFMFKQISGETPTVFSDQVADTLDGIRVNYYGQTQSNGQPLAFYQRGFNLDGEDTAVYCNEVWLKSHISTAIFNLLLATERVPANTDGEAMVYTTIAGAAQQAITNGTIQPGKTLTPAQRSMVYQLTGDSEAYMKVQNAGFWLDVVIEENGNDYKAVYKLVYGKGDSIRKVEGTDILM